MDNAFVATFLGSLFAIVVALALVYTLVTLYALPRVRAMYEAAAASPTRVGLRRDGEVEVAPCACGRAQYVGDDVDDPMAFLYEIGWRFAGDGSWHCPICVEQSNGERERIVFTCEEHGRCPGCPRVLAQFDAIARCQGADSMSPLEQRLWLELAAEFRDGAAAARERAEARS